jgi:anaerobic carbon-monoxide dehydrogenase, CODH/ACS complex subunit epsilon
VDKAALALAEVSGTKKAHIIAKPNVAVDLIKKANRPLLIVGSEAAQTAYDGKKIIDYVIELAKKPRFQWLQPLKQSAHS